MRGDAQHLSAEQLRSAAMAAGSGDMSDAFFQLSFWAAHWMQCAGAGFDRSGGPRNEDWPRHESAEPILTKSGK